jgi:hypothetical protein
VWSRGYKFPFVLFKASNIVDVTGEEGGDAVVRLEQHLKDLGDLWRDLEPLQRHEALKDLQDEVDVLAALGFTITAGADPMRLRSQHSDQAFTLTVLRVVVAPAGEPKMFAMRDKMRAGPWVRVHAIQCELSNVRESVS